MDFEYIKQYYKVPAQIGREIIFDEKRKGIIVKDLGHYIGVNFYDQDSTNIEILHPTYSIKYLETFGEIRPLTRGQKQYQDYLYSDSDLSFIEWLKSNRYFTKNNI